MIELSIIIPCYNEEKNLSALVAKCAELLKANPFAEIILVNNGSTDNSQQTFTRLLQEVNNPNLKTHRVPVNQGYGFGILEGLKQGSAGILCWTHADLQTDISDCIKAYHIFKKYDNPAYLIKGRRKKRKLFDVLFTSLMSYYVLYRLKKYISDVNAQPKLFAKDFYNSIAGNAPHDFSLDLYFLLHAKLKGKIIEFPVYFHKRVAGEAKGGGGGLKLKMKLTKRSLSYINKIDMKAFNTD